MRNTQNFRAVRLRAPAAPQPPIVGGELLKGRQLTFVEFLHHGSAQEFCRPVFGYDDTSGGLMLYELRKATEHAYFGLRAGKLTHSQAKEKALLKSYARRAYRGDPDRRGVKFWERVAWLLWAVYADVMRWRARAQKITQQEIARIDSLGTQRTKRAAYMRRYRAKRSAQAARYVKSEARQAWERKRLTRKLARDASAQRAAAHTS
jgi:hypothetical protein